MRDKKKRFLARFCAGAACLCLMALLAYGLRVARYQREVRGITYSDSDIAAGKLADGTYVGECDVDLIRARVAVTVREGRIAGIELLEHKNGRGKPAERVVGEIVREQRIDVDAVSGATNSSKVIKKAVELALEKAGSD